MQPSSSSPRFTSALATLVLTFVLPACSGDGHGAAAGPGLDAGGTSVGAGGAAADGGSPGTGAASGDGATAGPDLFAKDHVLEIALTVDPADWDTIRKQARSSETVFGGDCLAQPFASPFTFVPADVTIDGTTVPNVGIRKKGFLGSLDEDKPSLKIAFDQYQPQTLFGTKDLTLNNALQDASLVNQCIGYAVFAAAGVPAPRCSFAHVTVNGTDLGAYVNVEPVKKPMLRRHFASDTGNLYEGTLSDFRDGWLGTFDKKTNSLDPSRTDLDAVAAAAAAPDAELLARLGAVVDLDEFFSFWAAEVIVEHQDGYTHNENNFFAYFDPGTGKASLLPWGADQLLGTSDGAKRKQPASFYTTGVLAARLYAHPEGRSRFEARLSEILRTAWQPEALAQEVTRMEALLAPLVPAAKRAEFSAAIDATRTRIGERRATLEALLAGPTATVAPPRDPVCFKNVGSVSGTFDTTWGTVGTADPFSAGTGTLNVVVNGTSWVYRSGYVGAIAGPPDDPTSDVEASVVVPALRTDGMLALMYFGMDTAAVRPGDVATDMATSPALLLEMNPAVQNDPGRVVGALFGGTLHFDAASPTPGAPVTGTFHGTLYQTSLFGQL